MILPSIILPDRFLQNQGSKALNFVFYYSAKFKTPFQSQCATQQIATLCPAIHPDGGH